MAGDVRHPALPPVTKTWENQSVRVRKPEVAGLLDTWVRYVLTNNGGDYSAHIFPEPLTFRRMFYEAQVRLGWANSEGKVPFVPHSLRHGGASCDYLLLGGGKLEDILFRGRWGYGGGCRRTGFRPAMPLFLGALSGHCRFGHHNKQ